MIVALGCWPRFLPRNAALFALRPLGRRVHFSTVCRANFILDINTLLKIVSKTSTTIQSRDVPFSSATSLHPTPGG